MKEGDNFRLSTFEFQATFTVRSNAFINMPSNIDWLDDEQVRKYIIEHLDDVRLPDLEYVEILSDTLELVDFPSPDAKTDSTSLPEDIFG